MKQESLVGATRSCMRLDLGAEKFHGDSTATRLASILNRKAKM